MYAKATFLSQQHQFLFMCKFIIIILLSVKNIFNIIWKQFHRQREHKYIENRPIITYIF